MTMNDRYARPFRSVRAIAFGVFAAVLSFAPAADAATDIYADYRLDDGTPQSVALLL